VRHWLWVPFVLVLPSQAWTSPLTVEVLRTEYRTFVSADLWDFVTNEVVVTSNTQESSSPLSDAIVTAAAFIPAGATASAEFFSVAMSTASNFVNDEHHATVHARAEAETLIEFVPTVDGVARFTVDIGAGGNRPEFSSGFIQVVDLTLTEELLYLGWDEDRFFSDMSWGFSRYDPQFTMAQSFEHYWNRSHRYALTMFGTTNAEWDNQTLTMQVTGLQVVAEPPAVVLWIVGLISVVGCLKAGSPCTRHRS
jgi:hypothetical protein